MKGFFTGVAAVALAAVGVGSTHGQDLLKSPVLLRGSGFSATHVSVKTSRDHYYTTICDGNAATYWTPMEARGPHFIEMIWNHPVTVTGMVLRAEGVSSAALSAWTRGTWQPVAALAGDSAAVAFAAATSARFRLDLAATSAAPKIYELALPGPEQYVLPAVFPEGAATGRVTIADARLPQGTFRPGDRLTLSFTASATSNTAPYGLFVELSDRAALADLRENGSDFASGRWAARPDAAGRVVIEMELPPWTPHGTNDLLVFAVSDVDGRLVPTSRARLGSFDVRRDDLGEMPPAARSVRVAPNDAGELGFEINGIWHPPYFNRYYGNPSPERLAATARTGLEILYWQNRQAFPLDTAAEREARYRWFDARIRMALRVNPKNYFILSQRALPSPAWLRRHPEEMMLLEDGRKNPENILSFGSELYLRLSEEFLTGLAAFIARQPYAGRVIGYHLWTCTKYDGSIGGARPNRTAKGRADYVIGDYNPGAIRLFREFLRKKYGGDLAALRRAWRDESATFETARVSTKEILREDFPGQPFRDPVRSRAAIDYLEFFPTMLSRYFARTSAAIKRATEGRALVLAHYGAVQDHLAFAWAEQMQSGNFDFAAVLDTPDIDAFVQAQPYDVREAGNPVIAYPPVRSIALHGKLSLFDHDHRTCSSGLTTYGRHRSAAEGRAVFRRDYAHQSIENAGAWISDMSLSPWWKFEETRLAWFTTPETVDPLRETFADLARVGKPRARAAEVAVVLDLESPRYEDACRMVPLYRGLVNDLVLRRDFPRLGAPFDIILTDDLDHPNLPDYKLLLFVNATYASPRVRRAVERLKSGNRTLMWFYAPGYVTDVGLDLAATRALCGFDLKIRSGAADSPRGTFVAGTPLAEGLVGQELVTRTWGGLEAVSPTTMSPLFHAEGEGVKVVARDAAGRVVYAVREFGSWRSVWCGVPNFSLPALVNLCRFAGVHLYAEAPVVLNADSRLLMLHNGYEAGAVTRRITLPRRARVTDLTTGAALGEGTAFDIPLAAPETRFLSLDYR